MANYVAPEIIGYAQQIVKNAIGTQVKVKGFEWSAGGLFNKVFKVNTTAGDFILKIECDKIFFATRKEQIENEVLGNELFQKASIPCANILAYDYTKNDVGVRYIFIEHISNDMGDAPLGDRLDDFDEITKEEIRRQATEIFAKIQTITCDCFGSISPTGILGRYKTWTEYSKSLFDLLIQDGENCGTFTEEEIAILKEAGNMAFEFSKEKKIASSFVHGDWGGHNQILKKTGNGEISVSIIDFGNAYYGLPRFDEYIYRKYMGNLGFSKHDITDDMNCDKDFYENNLIRDFERMFWKETERLTEDYACCREWMIPSIKAAKKDTSRVHILNFVDKCRKIL